ncbi:uncharacterized protein LOC117186319 [Drosophila miranda]|uniref:uncharacterized protein LOC117186319 n=1 Tax=Drosophila miranda TaxID=7229 RepID=UPI00143F1409|nr:uncharacterized protein LOC117186319 [Drosophila miranda]
MPDAAARAGAPPPAPLGTTFVGLAVASWSGRVPAIARDLAPMAQVSGVPLLPLVCLPSLPPSLHHLLLPPPPLSCRDSSRSPASPRRRLPPPPFPSLLASLPRANLRASPRLWMPPLGLPPPVAVLVASDPARCWRVEPPPTAEPPPSLSRAAAALARRPTIYAVSARAIACERHEGGSLRPLPVLLLLACVFDRGRASCGSACRWSPCRVVDLPLFRADDSSFSACPFELVDARFDGRPSRVCWRVAPRAWWSGAPPVCWRGAPRVCWRGIPRVCWRGTPRAWWSGASRVRWRGAPRVSSCLVVCASRPAAWRSRFPSLARFFVGAGSQLTNSRSLSASLHHDNTTGDIVGPIDPAVDTSGEARNCSSGDPFLRALLPSRSSRYACRWLWVSAA